MPLLNEQPRDRFGMSAAPPKPLVIEFFGLSGTGKTTLARACVQRLRGIYPFVYSKPDVWNRTPWRRILPRMRTIIEEWPIAWSTMPLDFSNPSLPRHPGEPDIIYRLRAALNAPYYFVTIKRMADANPDSIILLDGWLVMNRIWGPCELDQCQVRRTSGLLSYFESQFNFVLVMLNIESKEAARRAYQRGILRRAGALDGWSRFDDADQDETAAYHKTREACVQCLRRRYAAGGGRLYELNADQPVGENADKVIDDIIRPYIESRRSREVALQQAEQRRTSTEWDIQDHRGVWWNERTP